MTISPFQKLAQERYSPENDSKIKNPYRSPFEELSQSDKYQEGKGKSFLRSALQIPQGIASATTPGIIAGVWQLLGQGEVLDPEEIEHIKAISEREGIPFDEEAYMQAAQEALETIPTVSNIGRAVEERTGVPLEPKTALQKTLNLASMAGKFQPGTLGQKAIAAGTAPLAKEGLEFAGVPEFLAEPAGLGLSTISGSKTPKIDISKSKKPSGLTTRQFEKLEKPVEISPKKIKQIDQKLESEFRDIASDIIEKSPINETHSELKNDVGFKLAAEEAFEKVDQLAENMPEKVSLEDLKKDLIKRSAQEKKAGITELEYDKEYNKFIKQLVKDTKGQETSLGGLVKQYRKNNEAFGKSWESAKSTDFNVAKRDALLDFNRTIADTIEKKFPDSEFANLFKSSNEQWKKIMDAEAVDAYINDIFEGKINYKKSGEFFNKRQKQIFKRALGEEGYKNFEQLNKDFMSTEKAHKMMKVANEKGFSDLASTGMSYLLHPKIAMTKVGIGIAKGAYKSLWESILDKPQLSVTWDKGIKAFEKGNFSKAETQFNKLDKEVERLKSQKSFNETIKLNKETKQDISSIPQEKTRLENPNQTLVGEKPEELMKNKSHPKPVKSSINQLEKKGFEYTVDDFKDIQEAKDYLSGLIRTSKLVEEGKKPLSVKPHPATIESVKDVIKEFAKKNSTSKAAQNLEKKLPEIKRQDISKKGLKTQKEWIINRVEDVIENPEKYKGESHINLSVPGDGEFKIKNDPKALNQFYKSVKSKWPDKPLKKTRSKSKDIEYPEYAYKEHEIAQQKQRDEYLSKHSTKYKKST